MQTRKLYEEDACTKTFRAKVLSCEPEGDGFSVVLSATAFFPEEGGQTADTGSLGGARVLDVRERDGVILHRTDRALAVGSEAEGALDWPLRWRKMQDHTGEHIVSGLVHRRYGYDNVGFHLGADGMTFDYNGELTRAQLDELEDEANAVVWADLPVRARFPSAGELKGLSYRSKLARTENLRLVEIEGVDLCACCAPHVASTGRVGEIKLLDFMRHRGGVRVWARCGADALADHRARYVSDAALSGLLNAPQTALPEAAEKLLAERDDLRAQLNTLRREALDARIAALRPVSGDMLLFADADADGLRALVNAGAPLCGGVCAAFSGADGAYRFVLGCRDGDARQTLARMKEPLAARGGGKPPMVTGLCAASRRQIEAFFAG